MGTTPTYSWPYPESTDPVANGAQDIEDLALAVENTVSGLGSSIAIFNETQSSGTHGGGYTASAYVKRTLNTVVLNNITGCSVAASVITLAAGTYQVLAHVPAYRTTQTRSRLYDTTNTATLVQSVNQIAENSYQGFTLSTVSGVFTLTGSTNIELQMRANDTQATNGLGAAMSTGEDEIYSQILIVRFG